MDGSKERTISPEARARTRILLVEDNAGLAENLSEILAGEGYGVVVAPDCARAREGARAGFDVALVDVRLPDGDGVALSPELKASSPGSEVVLLTAFASVDSAAAALRAGACAYLVKPCAVPELLLTVAQAERQVRAQAEARAQSQRAQVSEKLAAVGRLAAGLSHEIRNPLNAAGLQLSVLERRVRKLAEGQQAGLLEPLVLVRDEIRRLDKTLTDFLTFARPKEPRLAAVALRPVVEGVATMLAADFERRAVRLRVETRPDEPRARADADALRQVLWNLVLNALDASPAGTEVLLRVELLPTDRVQLAVEDQGVGVALADRERIFEPFFTTKPHGTGLGLSIVHSLVAQQRGRLWVDASPSGGAAFRVELEAG